MPTCLVDVLLAGVPDAGVEAAEEEAVVAGLPAVVHLARVAAAARLVALGAVVDAVVAPLLAAGGLGHALGALAPVRGDERRGGEEQRHQVEEDREHRAALARRLHDGVVVGGKFMKTRPERRGEREEAHGWVAVGMGRVSLSSLYPG